MIYRDGSSYFTGALALLMVLQLLMWFLSHDSLMEGQMSCFFPCHDRNSSGFCNRNNTDEMFAKVETLSILGLHGQVIRDAFFFFFFF